MKNQPKTEYYKISTEKSCPECGATIHISQECYLMECDRCLSKKQEC
ncbi:MULTISPECIES: protein YhfH [Bacillus]|nr:MULTISPECIES: protein YhfH [Bacillus]